MHETTRIRLVSYSVAVLAPAVSLLVRWPLWPVLGNSVPHMTFFPAVMVAAYFGGFWPGLLTTVISAVAANLFITKQLSTFHIASVNDLVGLILFILVGAFISGLCESLHVVRRRYVINEFERAQERERALEKLKQSERRLAEAQQVAHLGSWERDLRTSQVIWSDELYRLFGLKADEIDLSYERFLDFVVPQDVNRIHAMVDEAIRERGPFSSDYRITRADGSVRVMHEQGSVILNEADEPIRLIGTAQDVTEVRQAEQSLKEYTARLQSLSHRLIEVQEEERQTFVRELHDEVGQLLTILRLLLKPNCDEQSSADTSKLEQAQAIVDQLLDKVRGLSFDLRPTVLDQLGLVPALSELFENYTNQTGVQVRFQHKNAERRFVPEMETTAYRIVQEALTNVARHAGPPKEGVTVRVWATQNLLSVQIDDRGHGFDPEAVLATSRSGGLAGMRERVMLLNGQLTIDSKRGSGTQITAELPLGSSTVESKQPFHSSFKVRREGEKAQP